VLPNLNAAEASSPRVLPYSKVHAASYNPFRADAGSAPLRVDGEPEGDGVWNGGVKVYPGHEGAPAREGLPRGEIDIDEEGGETEREGRHSPHLQISPEEALKLLNRRSLAEPVPAPGGERFQGQIAAGRGGLNGSRAQARDGLRSRALSSIDAAIVAVSNHLEPHDRASRIPAPVWLNASGRGGTHEHKLENSPQLDLRVYDRGLHLRGRKVNAARNDDIAGAGHRDDHSVGSASSSIASATLNMHSRASGAPRANKGRSRGPTASSRLQSSDSVEISARTEAQTFPAGLNLRQSEESQGVSSHFVDSLPRAEAVIVSRMQEHPIRARSPSIRTVPAEASPNLVSSSPQAALDSAGSRSTVSESLHSKDGFIVRSGRPRKKSHAPGGPAKL